MTFFVVAIPPSKNGEQRGRPSLAANLAPLQTTLGPSGLTILVAAPGRDKIDVQFAQIIAHPDLYGVTDVTDPAYPNFDKGTPAVQVPNSDHYLSWDYIHPRTTKKRHRDADVFAARST
jgi:hypothetical protein